jgi:hypothetical protein
VKATGPSRQETAGWRPQRRQSGGRGHAGDGNHVQESVSRPQRTDGCCGNDRDAGAEETRECMEGTR